MFTRKTKLYEDTYFIHLQCGFESFKSGSLANIEKKNWNIYNQILYIMFLFDIYWL